MMAKHDWNFYERQCQAQHAHWLRSLMPAESLALYQELHRLARAQADDSHGWRRLQEARWKEKVAIRHKLHEAFARLDNNEVRNELATFDESL